MWLSKARRRSAGFPPLATPPAWQSCCKVLWSIAATVSRNQLWPDSPYWMRSANKASSSSYSTMEGELLFDIVTSSKIVQTLNQKETIDSFLMLQCKSTQHFQCKNPTNCLATIRFGHDSSWVYWRRTWKNESMSSWFNSQWNAVWWCNLLTMRILSAAQLVATRGRLQSWTPIHWFLVLQWQMRRICNLQRDFTMRILSAAHFGQLWSAQQTLLHTDPFTHKPSHPFTHRRF